MSQEAGGRRRLPTWVGTLGSAGVPESLVALVLLSLSLFSAGATPTGQHIVVEVVLALFAGASGRWPVIGALGTGAALVVLVLLHGESLPVSALSVYIPVVSTGVRGLRRLRDLCAIWYTVLLAALSFQISLTIDDAVQSILVLGALMLGAWGAGRSIGRLRLQGADAEERRLASLQAQRRSIARDLHDTVAYATSTMIMRAEQIKLRSAGDAELVADLDFIIATGRRSVRDLRGMLETLRRTDPAFDADTHASPWRTMPVTEVIESRRRELAGHGLILSTSLEADLDGLPESVRETLAKLVVEATSNMVKHAAPGPCRLIIETHDDLVEAVFTNRQRTPHGDGAERGLGLLGAAERVEALGGELEVTPVSGTWILRAQLPIGGE
ncbi:sensor histidine kinase [Propioniciclava soli]|uniref:histidine kinase n=1 Tax=Propioniciclava soli TaxID=2775081 RepID=A0ABZ3C9I5_9ACTN|nr:histidine kinase [Propioniciclava soli]